MAGKRTRIDREKHDRQNNQSKSLTMIPCAGGPEHDPDPPCAFLCLDLPQVAVSRHVGNRYNAR